MISLGHFLIPKLHIILTFLATDVEIVASSEDGIYATVLNGFLLVLSEDGDIIYLSENVEEFTGISQVFIHLGNILFIDSL